MNEFDRRLPEGWKVWPGNAARKSGEESTEGPLQQSRQERELDMITGNAPATTRSIPIRLLTELLLAAKDDNRQWLEDFADDVVTIDADLHDVLLAYQKYSQETRNRQHDSTSRGPRRDRNVAA